MGQSVCAVMIQNGRVQTSIKILPQVWEQLLCVHWWELFPGHGGLSLWGAQFQFCRSRGPRRSKHGIPLLGKPCGSEASLQWMHLAEGEFCLPQIHGFHNGHVIQWSTALNRVQPCRRPSSAEPKHGSDSYIISSLDIKKNVHWEWLIRKCLIIIS